MASIRITSARLSDTGIQNAGTEFTLQQIIDYNKEEFGDDINTNCLDDLIEFVKALNITNDLEVLKTYTTGNGTFFSYPAVQLNSEGVLSLVMASTVMPLIYDAKSKTYSVEGSEITFKPLGYVPDPQNKVVTAAYFSTSIEVEVDGMMDNVEYSIAIKTKSEDDLAAVKSNFKSIVIALQKGEALTSDHLIQIGAGGNYQKPLKPWMLPKGFYKVVQVDKMETINHNGKSFTVQNGYVAPVDLEGEPIDDVRFMVSLKASPFIANSDNMRVRQAENGRSVFVGIDGAFTTSDGKVSTIGYCEKIGNPQGEFTAVQFKQFMTDAKKAFIAKRRSNSSNLLSPERINTDRDLYLGVTTASNTIEATESQLAPSIVPAFDDIPF